MDRDKEHKYVKELVKAVENPLPEMKDTFEKEFILLKEICENKKVLDVGCGTGRPADKLTDFCKEIICIDDNGELLEMAERNLSGKQNAKVISMDALNMEFRDEKFDVVYATYNLIGSIDSKEKLVEKMSNVTKKGGTLVIITWKRDNETTEFLRKYYSNLGFEVVDINENKTILDRGVFDRVDSDYIVDLMKVNNFEKIEAKDLGLWCAIIGNLS